MAPAAAAVPVVVWVSNLRWVGLLAIRTRPTSQQVNGNMSVNLFIYHILSFTLFTPPNREQTIVVHATPCRHGGVQGEEQAVVEEQAMVRGFFVVKIISTT